MEGWRSDKRRDGGREMEEGERGHIRAGMVKGKGRRRGKIYTRRDR